MCKNPPGKIFHAPYSSILTISDYHLFTKFAKLFELTMTTFKRRAISGINRKYVIHGALKSRLADGIRLFLEPMKIILKN